MTDIDRLETIDHQFRRANELAATDPEAAALLYAVASEWFRSLFLPDDNALCSHSKALRIDFKQ